MAVEARYFSTRDPDQTMFADKKDADAHDRLLEATEEVAAIVELSHPDITADMAYRIAMAMVGERDALMAALKKAPKSATIETHADAADNSDVVEAPAAATSKRKTGKNRAA